MAKIIGIDIRNQHVRGALLSASYRRLVLLSLVEVDRSQFEGLDQAVQACLVTLVPHSDSIAVAVDGDLAFIHRLDLPPTAMKQLAEVIPFELEAQVPVEMDQLVYDSVTLPRQESEGTISVLTAAVRTDHVKERLELVRRTASREAERVGVGALPLANLATVIPALASDEPVAVVELGHDRSEVIVMHRSYPMYARTLSIGVSGLPQSAPQLAAQLRQTLTAASTQLHAPVRSVYLTGGGATAGGAEAYLAAELGVSVSSLPAPALEGITPEYEAVLPRFSRALGLAIGLRGRPKDLDLRRGELSYEHGFAFLKEKAPLLGALAGAILLSFFFASWAELRSLGHEHEKLSAELSALSKEALGEEIGDPDQARELLETASQRAEIDPMPHIDGFDVMVDLSNSVPETITHDVEELDMTREHAKIRGIVGSAQEAQQIADKLKQDKCFGEPKITKVSQVVNGTRQKYVLESDLKCPEDAVAKKKSGDSEEGSKGQ